MVAVLFVCMTVERSTFPRPLRPRVLRLRGGQQVGHDVSRYTRVSQPALLVFDHEDDGHPISVGRRMRTNLPCSHWCVPRTCQ